MECEGFFNALGKNSALIVVAVVNVVASVVTGGGWVAVLTATLAFAARSLFSSSSYISFFEVFDAFADP